MIAGCESHDLKLASVALCHLEGCFGGLGTRVEKERFRKRSWQDPSQTFGQINNWLCNHVAEEMIELANISADHFNDFRVGVAEE